MIRPYTKDDEETVKKICYESGSETVKKSYTYIGRATWFHHGNILYYLYNDVGFYFAGINQKSVRLYVIAVREDYHSKGIGSVLLEHLKRKTRELGLSKITFRTTYGSQAFQWWLRKKARIVGRKGADVEMEVLL